MTKKGIQFKDQGSLDGVSVKSINFTQWGGIENFLMSTSGGAGGTAKPQML